MRKDINPEGWDTIGVNFTSVKEAYDRLHAACANAEVLQVAVENVTFDGNLKINLNSVSGILPFEKIDYPYTGYATLPRSAATRKVGKIISVCVETVEPEIVFSRIKAIDITRDFLFNNYQDSWLNGIVVGFAKNQQGAIVDVGNGVRSYLSSQEVSTVKTRSINERFVLGQRISVKISAVDINTNYIRLSMLDHYGTRSENLQCYAVGQIVAGIVRETSPKGMGVFLEITPVLDGIADFFPGVKYGDTVAARIKKIDLSSERISLVIQAVDLNLGKNIYDFSHFIPGNPTTIPNILAQGNPISPVSTANDASPLKEKKITAGVAVSNNAVKTTVSPFALRDGEYLEITNPGAVASTDKLHFLSDIGSIKDIHNKILQTVYNYGVLTCRMLYLALERHPDVISQNDMQNRLNILVANGVLTQYAFRNSESKSNFRMYTVAENGRRWLQHITIDRYIQNKQIYSAGVTNGTGIDAIRAKKVLAVNQCLISMRNLIDDFQIQVRQKSVPLARGRWVYVQPTAFAQFHSGESIFIESVRRNAGWKQDFEDKINTKINRLLTVIDNYDIKQENQRKTPTGLLFIGEDADHIREIIHEVHNNFDPQIKVYYTWDTLLIQLPPERATFGIDFYGTEEENKIILQ